MSQTTLTNRPPGSPTFVVIDGSSEAELTGRMIKARGAHAILTVGVSQALGVLSEAQASGAVIDCSAHSDDPVEATRRIRESHPGLPIVVIAEPNDARMPAVFAAGATDFVPFPVTGTLLNGVIRRIERDQESDRV